MTTTSTPWGRAHLLERLEVPQQSADRRFASVVELLETDRGERLVRFAYTTEGSARRGPVTFRRRDLDRLRRALAKTPGIAEALGIEALGIGGA